MQIRTSKTEVQVTGRDTAQSVIHVKLDNNELKQTEDFVYMGGTVSSDTSCDKDTACRVGLAAGAARSLEKIWKARDISKETKILSYHSLVQSILLYNTETWTLKEENKISLQVFEMSVLRKILGCTRRDRVRNADITKDLALDMDIVEVLHLRRLTYFGHCTRMDPSRYPHILLYGHTDGARSGRGGLTT